MSELKKYELTVECTSFNGSQTFACYAENETQALNLFKAGKCVIIDEQIEVLGLEEDSLEIIESNNIDSRLPSDVICELSNTIAEQEKVISELSDLAYEFISTLSLIGNDCGAEDTEDFVHNLLAKYKQSKGE